MRAAVTSAQQGERMALARELHDVVAHHVTGIVVQAQAALLVAEKNPDVAVPALEKIERSGTEALTAMRTLVGSLREGTAAWTAGDADATDQATTDLAADIARAGRELRRPAGDAASSTCPSSCRTRSAGRCCGWCRSR